MANYLYTDLPEFSILPFNPYADSLDFTGSGITSWAQIRIGDDDDEGEVSLFTDQRFIFLRIDDPLRFTEANFVSPDGGRFLIGDNSNAVREDDLANTLIGGSGADLLAGLGGNDSVSAGGSDDLLMMFGGDGNDGFGNDTIDGGLGFDLIDFRDIDINGSDASINANLTSGSITLTGGAGNVTVSNIEALIAGGGNDTLTGSTVANYLNGRDGNDSIDGGDGADTLIGSFGNDTLQGGLGDDLIRGGFGADSMMGGAGNDTYHHFGSNDVISDSGGTDTALVQRSNSIQNATGVENLTLVGTVGPDSTEATFARFFSGDYNDDDNPFFGLVAELSGNSLANVITGNNQFNLLIGGGGNDTIDGGGGLDIAEYDSPDSSLVPTGNLSVTFTAVGTGTATAAGTGTDVLSGIEGIVGGQFNDTIDGGAAVVDHQIFIGANGNDTIRGGGGNDTIFGQSGNDSLDGGAGNGDVLAYFDADTGLTVNLNFVTVTDDGRDNSSLPGYQGGTDSIANFEGVAGGTFNDSLTGDVNANRLWGGAGNDTLIGGSGNDMLDGGLGMSDQVRYDDLALGAQNGIHVNLALGLARDASQAADLGGGLEATLDAILPGFGHLDTLANIEWIVGPTYDDTLIGGNPNHQVEGFAFTDSVEIFEGRRGNDSIDGGDHNGAGSDNGYTDIVSYLGDLGGVGVTVNLGAGTAIDSFNDPDTLARIDGVWGSAWADSLTGGSTSQNFYGQQFEFFLGGGGNDTIDGGTGLDRADYHILTQQGITATLINGEAGTWTVIDGTDQDTATGGVQQGTDSLSGIEGIRGSAFNDTLTGTGSSGDQDGHFFEGMGGNDVIQGWNGLDIARYDRSTSGVTVNLTTDTASDGFGGSDTLINIEGASGTDFGDFFVGQAGQNNSFDGRGGVRQTTGPFTYSDTVDYSQGGHTGPITVNLATGTVTDGGGGNDTLGNIEAVFGTAAADTFTGSDTSLEYTGTFTDRSERFRGGGGNDTFDGGSSSWGDNDTLDYGNSTLQVNVDLSAGTTFNDGFGGIDTFTNIDAVFGGSGNDFLTGGSDSRGYSGAQFETFRGGAGNDFIDGRDGFDTADYSNATTSVFVNLGSGSGFGFGFGGGTASDGLGGTDQLFNIEQVRGGQFNDNLTGGGNGSGNREVFQGNAGDDFIDGEDDLDLASYASSPNAVYVDTGRGFALDGWGGIDSLANIEGAQGSDFNDTLIGGLSSNNGEADWQVFEGRAGDDLIDGADGFDSGIPGVIDNDLDAAEYRNAPGAVNVNLATGVAQDGYGTTDALVGIEIVVGSRGNDTIIGGNASSVAMRFEGFDGRAGDDSMAGGIGDDWLLYEDTDDGVVVNMSGSSVVVGSDTVLGGTALDGWGGTDTITGMEHLIGSSHDDVLIGSAGANFIHGDDGEDFLVGGAGNDSLDGGDGGDNIGGLDLADYSASVDSIDVNLATGRALAGADGNDLLTNIEAVRGGIGNDTLTGDQWDSLLEGGAGDDLLDGNGGPDWVSYEHDTGGALVNLATQTATDGLGGTDTLRSIENARGGAFDDTLTGSAGDNVFYGDLGNDSIDGGAGSDTVTYHGASGGVTINLVANTVTGAAGDDLLSGIENVVGSEYADTITGASLAGAGERSYLQGGGGADAITGGGGAGTTILSFADEFSQISINFATGSGNVTINGEITVFANIDGVVGGWNWDTLTGGAGNDYFEGGFGQDTIVGAGGFDTASYRGAINPVIVNLGAGSQTVNYVSARGDSFGNQTINGGTSFESDQEGGDFFSNVWFDSLNSIERIEGGAFADTMFGGFGTAESFDGGAGNDVLRGGGGNAGDTFVGGAGFDQVNFGGTTSGSGVNVDLQAGTAVRGGFSATDSLSGIEQILGTQFNDTIEGAVQVYTGRFHDFVTGLYSGGGGNDSIDGGSAANGQNDAVSFLNTTTPVAVTANLFTQTASGGATLGTDTLVNIDEVQGGTLADTLTGGSSSAGFSGYLFESFRGNAGNDSIDGGLTGEDRVDYRFSTGAVVVTLGTGTANGTASDGEGGTDTLKNVENVRGSAFSDLLKGGGTQNAGTLYDYEVFEGMEGNDTIDGLGGVDVASYFSSDAGVTVNLALGFALDGMGTRDTLVNIEQVTGSDYDDLLIGSNSLTDREAFRGGAGNDTIDGGAGNDLANYNASPNAVNVNLATGVAQDGYGDTDTLINIEAVRASIGNDTLLGGAGNETFEGIQGNDSIDGGGGNNRADYLRDFAAVNVNLDTGVALDGFGGTDTLVNIQSVRGSGFNDALLGGAGNDTIEGAGGNDALAGGAGNDIASYRSSLNPVSVNLSTGTASDGWDKDLVTTGIQAGTDSLTDFEGILGSDFNDTLVGGASSDTLIGGLGNDAYTVGAGDVIVEVLNEGFDTVNSSATFVLGDNIENLTLTGIANISGTGNSVANQITGNAGANSLDGGTGADTLTGGAGNDTYFINSGLDSIVETATGGIDTIILVAGFSSTMAIDAPVELRLADNLENVTVASDTTVVKIIANAANNFLIGNLNSDTLEGGAGNDTLDGGQGIDTLKGGTGNDVFFIRNLGDVAEEAASAGTDLVFTSLAITSLGLNIENLTLQDDISITIGRGNALNNYVKGNSFDNSLFGNDGNDTLEGGGGSDRLYGGAGSDSYVLDGGDLVIEVSGSKSDQALVKQSVDLRTSVGIEGAKAQAGLYDIDITGNKQGNKIDGNETNNRLEGGKAGKVATNDTLDGGLGSDTYVISSALDKIIDTGGTGDGIETDFNMSLVPFATIENLYQIGTGNIVGVGNALANLMRGNTGNNLLTGMDGADDIEGNAGNDTLDGGKGNDRLYGGEGNDTFVLDNTADLFFESVRFETVSVTASSDLQPGTVISGDGRYIQFTSATSLVASDTNGVDDTFVKDMLTGTVTRASSGTAEVTHSSLNPGGRFVAFTTTSSLVTADGNVLSDVYLRDLTPPTATTPATVLLSRATTGQAGNGASVMSDISSDGRFVAISSHAENLVADNPLTLDVVEDDDSNNFEDVFLIDRIANTLVRVSLADDETQANADSGDGVAISANGRLVAFGSTATNLVEGGTSAVGHIFVRDLGAQTTEFVSVDTNEVQADAASSNARISNDGRYVVFESAATNLVASDTNGVSDIFMRDLALDTTVRVSQSAADAQGNGASSIAGISADGRYVVFQSNASNLVAGDTNGLTDVFVKDLQTDAIARVSFAANGTQSNVHSVAPDISEDGRYIVFTTGTNVVRIANPLIMGSGGIDTVVAPFSHTLGDEFENLTLSGTAAINGTGNALDNVLTGNSGANVLNGGAGNDTYVVGAGDTIIDSDGTDTVIASVNTTLGGGLEHLTLAGTTPLAGTGNAAHNYIKGNAAANTLAGGGGNDTLEGGAGNDVYVSDGLDTVIELANGGTDTVQNTANVNLTVLLNVENVLLLGGANVDAIGNDGANLLTGNTGANVLNGGLGNDTMVGLAGNDTYHVNAAGDVVTEAGTDTGDMVISGISYALGATLEHLTLTGNDGLTGTGNASNNSMTGNAGNNVLDGKAGVDSMSGGDGADVYFVDAAGEVVTETGTDGAVDEVRSSANFDASGIGLLERIMLLGAAAVSAVGNALDNFLGGNTGANTLTGNAGNDTLDGGTGVDALNGGAGNDLYFVDATGDVITDSSGTNDSVISSATYALALAGGVENLTLTGTAATATGNELANTLKGNAAANVLTGGLGADAMEGGAGNDTYVVDASDTVIEVSNGGIDTAQSAGTLAVPLWDNVENLTLTASGSATGNALNNVLTGFTGADTLDGGLGNDTLVGGAGDDTYYVNAAGDVVTELAAGGTDTVIASVNYVLGATLEHLTLSGTDNISGTGNIGNNSITGNDGDNYLSGGAGADTLVGGGGFFDVADYAGTTTAVTVDLGAGTASGGDTISDIEGVRGTSLADTLTGAGPGSFVDYSSAATAVNVNLATNSVSGGGGNDLISNFGGIRGSAGNDTLTGDVGDNFFYANFGDSITGGDGNDTIYSSTSFSLANAVGVKNLILIGTTNIDATGDGNDNVITGNAGNNYLAGKGGNDTLYGGSGELDIADYSGTTTGVVVNLGTGIATGDGNDSLAGGIEGVRGSAFNDTLTGTGTSLVDYAGFGSVNANLVTGLASGAGNDTISGFAGIRGSDVSDILIGDGLDNVFYATSGDIVTGGGGTDTVFASTTFTLSSADLENLSLTGSGNFSGTGNDGDNVIVGNTGNNSLSGAGGNDTLDGGAGNDTLNGGTGDDVYYVDAPGDVIQSDDGGTDKVYSGVSFTLTAGLDNLELTGSALNATGNGLGNILTGNGGGNTLDGKGGADTMAGGDGNDTYIVDDAADQASDSGGFDVVLAGATFTLGAGVENLTLTGIGNIGGTGNLSANLITGNAGSNALDGGAGNDTLVGGLGNDTYTVDSAGDVVTELAAAGTDTLRTQFNTTLAATLENLVILSGAGHIGTGNAAANSITGGAGHDTLSGGGGNDGNDTLDGGTGNDLLTGGNGNDSYVVDSLDDVVVEADGVPAGIDGVQARINWTLGLNLENLAAYAGIGDWSGNGNAANNIIAGAEGNDSLFGDAGADTLNGGLGNDSLDGGLGIDSMAGGAGDDLYVIDVSTDKFVEAVGAGTDTLVTPFDIVMVANFENLTLAGTGNTKATGNDLANVLTGNDGNNLLTGLGGHDSMAGAGGNDTLDGGAGNDTLAGGSGDDRFVFDNGNDVASEAFNAGNDTVVAGTNYVLGAGSNLDNLVLTGTAITGSGNELDNRITGNAANNTLTGGEGNDTLDGGAGADFLLGGNGNDAFIWDANDTAAGAVIGGAGNDSLVFTGAGQTLNLNLAGVSERFQGIERVDIGGTAGINTFIFEFDDIRDLSNESQVVRIDGDLFDAVRSEHNTGTEHWELLGVLPDGDVFYIEYMYTYLNATTVTIQVNQDVDQFIS